MISNERFLEIGYVDDLSTGDDEGEDSDSDGPKGIVGRPAACTSVETSDIDDHVYDGEEKSKEDITKEMDMDIDKGMESEEKNQMTENENQENKVLGDVPHPDTAKIDVRSTPTIPFFAILSRMGDRVPCNLEYCAYPSLRITRNLPFGSEWSPLPNSDPTTALTRKRKRAQSQSQGNRDGRRGLIHIPYATLLPPSSIAALSSRQLYGRQSPTLHKRRQSDLASHYFITGSNAANHREEYVKHLIQKLDRATQGLGGGYWNYGWDMIQYVVDRNERRSYLDTMVGRKRRLGILSRYEAFEIVPKSLLAGSNEEGDTGDDSANDRSDNIISGAASAKNTNLEGTGTVVIYDHAKPERPLVDRQKIVPLDKILSPSLEQFLPNRSKVRTCSSSRRSTSIELGVTRKAAPPMPPPRPPGCSPASDTWTWTEIASSFTDAQKTELERKALHSDTEVASEGEYHRILGTLKVLRDFHMWEQARMGDWDGPCVTEKDFEDKEDENCEWRRVVDNKEGDCGKRIKAAFRRAKRLRLGRDREIKNDRKERKRRIGTSKVIWATSTLSHKVVDDCVVSMEEERGEGEQYMEFDLGECEVVVMVPVVNETSANKVMRKKVLAFRSLEISLKI